jgi:hypothetical protein
MIYKTANFETHPRPLSLEKRGEIEPGNYAVNKKNSFYEVPLFFIKERGAAAAGGEFKNVVM